MIREVPRYFLFGGYEGSQQLLTLEGQTIESLSAIVNAQIQ